LPRARFYRWPWNWTKPSPFSDLTRKMGDIGLFGMFVSEKYDGPGHGLHFLHHRRGGDRPGGRLPGGHHCGRQLPGDRSACITSATKNRNKNTCPNCATEKPCGVLGSPNPPPGRMPAAAKTTAVRDGNEWVINGSKIFITNAASEMTLGVTVQAVTGTRETAETRIHLFYRGDAAPTGSRPCP
jgi:short/branched chain acyl-CoA dehydrogenase